MDSLKQLYLAKARTRFLAAALIFPLAAHASDSPKLQLAVLFNHQPLNEIATFVRLENRKIFATRGELEGLGVKLPGAGRETDEVDLDELPGLKYTYLETSQELDIEILDNLRVEHHVDASAVEAAKLSPETSSLVVNYNAFLSGNYNPGTGSSQVNGTSLTLDIRASSKFGVIRQSGIASSTSPTSLLRLDTNWSCSDEETLQSTRAGDFISRGLTWTRPVRMGGFQLQRNFGLRPGLVTLPLPSFRGSAAVPSTLDVYVNDIKSYSTEIGTGPFSIDNLPISTSSNDMRVVITDVTGRKTEQSSPVFTSPNLLRKGLFDYSLSVGALRRNYGTESFDYDATPAAVGDLRYGLSNVLTGEAHAEAIQGLLNGGIGGYLPLNRNFGMFNAAVAASASSKGSGVYAYGGWQGKLGAIDLAVSGSRRFGLYQDLAAFTFTGNDPTFNGEIPIAREQVSIGYYQAIMRASLYLSALHIRDGTGKSSYFASVDFSKQMARDATLFGNAYLGNGGTYGFGLGMTIPLNRDIQTSTRAQSNGGQLSIVSEASRAMSDSAGSYGWRIANSQSGSNSLTSATATYKTNVLRTELGGTLAGDDAGFYAQADGAAVLTDGNLFLANKVNDAFAVVDAGVPFIPVKLENRDIGRTNGSGKFLVTGLRAYQDNKISLDVTAFPISANVASTEMSVTPREFSGVLADFGATKVNSSAIIILTDEHGAPLAPGIPVTLEKSHENVLMGYDGKVYLTRLGKKNKIVVRGNGSCAAEFQFVEKKDIQEVIGPIICRPFPESPESSQRMNQAAGSMINPQ